MQDLKNKPRTAKRLTLFGRTEKSPKTSPQIPTVTAGAARNPDLLMSGFRELAISPVNASNKREILRTYERMMLDDRVSQAVSIVNSAVKSLHWRIGSANPEAASLVRDCLESIDFKRFLGNLLDARIFGYSVFEEVWEIRDGLYRLKEERYLPYDRIEFETDKFGTLAGVKFDDETHPADWFHVFTYPEVRPGSLHYGVSELKKIHREWFTKDTLKKYRNIGLENFAYPLMVVTYDESRYRPGSAQWDELVGILTGLKNDSRVAIPGGTNPSSGEIVAGAKIEFLAPDFAGGGFEAFEQAIASEDKAIARNLGLPDDLGFTTTGSGSYSKAAQEFEIFWRVVTDVATLIAGNIQKVANRIADYNFADTAVRFEFDLSQESGLTESKARALSLLKDAGVAVSDEFLKGYLGTVKTA